jgi:hypothetical protein
MSNKNSKISHACVPLTGVSLIGYLAQFGTKTANSDYSQPHCKNFDNFLRRPTFALASSTFLYFFRLCHTTTK